MKKERIMVVTPHVDDETYGMGGTILKKITQGHDVHIVAVCAGNVVFEHGGLIDRSVRSAELDRVVKAYGPGCTGTLLPFTEESRMDTLPIRSIVQELEAAQDQFGAGIWYVPGMSYHQDHRRVFEACMAATRPTRKSNPSEIYVYETPLYSWNPPMWRLNPHVYEDIGPHLEEKIRICNLYESQKREGVLSPDHIREYSMAMGSESNFAAAERFEVIRILRG